MSEKGFKRKLAAILSADVVGYSRLMQDDEEATVRDIADNRVLISDIIQQHNGRVVDSPGDNILAEFASVVDAVNGAVEIQRALADRNEELPDERKMHFRIGVNLGDVIDEEDRIYGDGVNIAARIETLAEPGKVAISKNVYRNIRNKLKFGYEYQGEHQVKNISEPVRVYKVLTKPEDAGQLIGEPKVTKLPSKKSSIAIFTALVLIVAAAIWQFYPRPPEIEPASVENMAYPLPEKPSIAVLPFVNMSGDPEQEYISDSITENIITALSYVQEMFVIARTSTFVYKGKSVKIKQISEELGVRYVLEGSIQKADDQIRVTAQLIDAISGHHLWANRYDRNIEEFFKVLDEIAKEVVIELQVKLTEGDVSRIAHKTENFEAWLSAITGYYFVKLGTKENIAKARELFEKAVRLDPEYGFAWSGLGAAHNVEGIFGWGESREKSFELAGEYIDKAIKLDENLSCATSLKGRLYRIQGQLEQAIITGKKAIALGPSHDLPYSILSNTMRYVGRYEESIALMEKAIRLNPYYPAWYLSILAMDYFFLERYEEAIEVLTRLLERAQKGEYPPLYAHLRLSANYIALGKYEEAKAHAEQVNKINQNFSLERLASDISQYKIKTDYERYLESLRKAGYPDKPPLPLPDKPSIAVLPFENMSGDPEQQYFSDGITEQIITSISKVPYILVIARQSSFAFRDKQLTVQDIAKKLGVRYILEGSLQRSGERLRINVQLIDATSEHHIWAENYDRKLDDIFAVQDDICKNIMVALQVKLTWGETARIAADTVNIRAYEKYLKAAEHLNRRTKEDSLVAKQLTQEAIALDPEYAGSYILLGFCYLDDIWLGLTRTPSESIAKAEEMARKVAAIEGTMGRENIVLCGIYVLKKDYDKAIASAKKYLKPRPNVSAGYHMLGFALRLNGQYEEAISSYKKALQLNPVRPIDYLNNLAWAYLGSQQYEKAISTWNEAVERNPDYLFAYLGLTAAYWITEFEDRARQAAKQALRINSKFTVGFWKKVLPFGDEAHGKQVYDAWRKAGIPE